MLTLFDFTTINQIQSSLLFGFKVSKNELTTKYLRNNFLSCVPGQARDLTCSSSSMFYKDSNSPQDNK